jgi:hypothetical protein
MLQITKKITGYSVASDKPADTGASPAPEAPEREEIEAKPASNIVQMHESVERPEILVGETYKIKSPLFEHAIYVTVNDIVLNQGTEYEQRRPFEVFVNSKNMDHFQWIVALTRVMSAVFRKGGDVTFLVEELKAVFDPRGGYWKPGGVFVPSLVADLGNIIEQHLKMIGLIKAPELSDAQKALIAEKREAFEARAHVVAEHTGEPAGDADDAVAASQGDFPAAASLCHKCNTKALVLMDGCQTCLNCGYSKCG